jgi:hypothetical protein
MDIMGGPQPYETNLHIHKPKQTVGNLQLRVTYIVTSDIKRELMAREIAQRCKG